MRSGCREQGQGLVEAALVAPILVLVVLLAIDLGRVYFDHLAMRNAVREGAMYGGANPTDDCTAELAAVVSDELGGASVSCGSGTYQIVSADCFAFTAPNTYTACGTGPWNPTSTLIYGVRLQHQFRPVVPFVGLLTGNGMGGAVPLAAEAHSPVLDNYGS